MPATEHGLLGRESELAALDRLIGDAARGRGRVVALRGEPGIGKTRLAREALSRCERRGFELFAAAAEEMERRRPFGVVSDALGVDRAHDRERAEIRALLRGGGMAGGGVLAESAVLESRVAELVLEHVEGLCARHRVALLLEDLHWADPSSLLALHRIARAAGELGLLVICTLRPYPERRELRALLASLERLGATRLELEALDAGAVGALAERVAGAPPSAALRRRLEAVGGNPLFVIELVAALGAEGRLEGRGIRARGRARPAGRRARRRTRARAQRAGARRGGRPARLPARAAPRGALRRRAARGAARAAPRARGAADRGRRAGRAGRRAHAARRRARRPRGDRLAAPGRSTGGPPRPRGGRGAARAGARPHALRRPVLRRGARRARRAVGLERSGRRRRGALP